MHRKTTNDTAWWNHPERPCAGRDEFADLTLIPIHAQKVVIAQMQRECESCPVLRQCREDLLSHTKDWEHWGMQAGIEGRH